MPRTILMGGVSWLATPANRVSANQKETVEIGIACRRCVISRAWFTSIKHALSDGWRRIERWTWHTEPYCDYRGLCPVCRSHPEERG